MVNDLAQEAKTTPAKKNGKMFGFGAKKETTMPRTACLLVSIFVIAAWFATDVSAATRVGAEGVVEIVGDDGVQLEGEGETDRAGLVGCYDVTGVDTKEGRYTGVLCIAGLGDLLYELTWTQDEEDEGLVVYEGRGVSVGDDLFAVWREKGTDYDCYLHLFDIDTANGTLDGPRVNVSGATSSQTGARNGTETPLDWSEPGQLAGSYVIESSDEYTGKGMTVSRLPVDGDDVYSFRWMGDTALEGVGVREDNSIAVIANPVGQAEGTCGSITFTKNRDNRKLVGSFFTLDSLRGKTSRRRGEETATPR